MPEDNSAWQSGPTLFEGIASIEVQGEMVDAYMTAQMEGNDTLVRWFGTFSWMGDKEPKGFKPGGLHYVTLSDGRTATIHVPHYASVPENKLDFLGQGLPPGFEPLYTKAVLPPEYLSRVAPSVSGEYLDRSRWRVTWGRVAFAGSMGSMISAFWVDGHRYDLMWTGIFLWLWSMILLGAQGSQDKKIREADQEARVNPIESQLPKKRSGDER